MTNVSGPILLNSSGTAHDDWREFAQETGLPERGFPSPRILESIILRRLQRRAQVLLTGDPGGIAGQILHAADLSVVYVEHAALCDTAGVIRGAPAALTVLAGLESIPLTDGSFDGAVCLSRFSHLRWPRCAMEELHRVCKPGSILIFDVLTRHAAARETGQPLDADTVVVGNTLYRFMDWSRVEALTAGLFDIVEFRPMVNADQESLLCAVKRNGENRCCSI
jgi:SAM-dependent methyltransferase